MEKIRFTFRKYERICKQKEIQNVLDNGEKFFVNGVIVYLLPRPEKEVHSRLAVLVSKKIEKSAVVRNKFKRRIREIFRLNKHKIKIPVDIIVIPTKLSLRKKFKELQQVFLNILAQKNLLVDDNGIVK